MYNQPYFIPGMMPQMMAPPLMRGARIGFAPLLGRTATAANATRGLGLMSRLGNSFAAIRSLNWGGLINNTSKTLGVINQTIPLVKQVGPMMNNVKSMLRVASVFKDETDRGPRRKVPRQTNHTIPSPNNSSPQQPHSTKTQENIRQEPANSYEKDHSPTFFISS